jgi:hypothetical protein
MANIPIPAPGAFNAELCYVADQIGNTGLLAEAVYAAPRTSRRGEQFVKVIYQTLHTLSNEGSLFVAQTATPGTGVAVTPATGTSFVDTNALLGINNIDTTIAGNRTVIPLSLQIIVSTIGLAATSQNIAGRLDLGAGMSGGTQLTGKACNPNFANDGVAQIFANPTVAAATGSVRRIGRQPTRSQILVAGDVITILWGAVEEVQAQAISATAVSNIVVHLPATEIPPGWCYALNEWSAARTAAQTSELIFQYAVR